MDILQDGKKSKGTDTLWDVIVSLVEAGTWLGNQQLFRSPIILLVN